MLFALDGEIISAGVLGATIPSVDSEADRKVAVVSSIFSFFCENEVITEHMCGTDVGYALCSNLLCLHRFVSS